MTMTEVDVHPLGPWGRRWLELERGDEHGPAECCQSDERNRVAAGGVAYCATATGPTAATAYPMKKVIAVLHLKPRLNQKSGTCTQKKR
jgi:hypothetical protein